jgi:hypothetical protein
MGRFRADCDEWFWEYLGVAEELRDMAAALGADRVQVHIPRGGEDRVVVTYEGGAVWIEGEDFGIRIERRVA